MVSKKILFRILLNTLLGLILVLVWLKFVNLEEILKTLSQVTPLSLLPIFLFFLLGYAIRSFKLKYFLKDIKKISFKDIFFITGVAAMLNFLIPIRAGEIAKGIYLSQNYSLPMAKSLVWIFLDRFIDFLVVFIAASFLLYIYPTNAGSNLVWAVTLVALVLSAATYLIAYQTAWSKKLIITFEKLLILKPLQKIFLKISNFFLETFSVFKRSIKDLFVIFSLSILGYLADAAIWVYTFKAIGIDEDIFKMFLAQLLSALTYLIPAAPGYVGSTEASGLLIFSGIFGIEANLASAMIVLFHVCAVVFILIFGLISLHAVKFNLSSVWKAIKDGQGKANKTPF